MSNLNFNKISAGVLIAAVVVVGSSIISDILFAPDKLTKQAYIVEGVSQQNTQAKAKGPAYLTGEAFAALVDQGNIAKGKKVAKKCVSCHSFNAGEGHKIGPALHNIFNAPVAQKEGFKNYSDGLKSLDAVWDVETLNIWLYKPKALVKQNNMSFAGIRKDADRAALIAYIKSLQ